MSEYAQERSGGGSVYATPSSSGGSVYAGKSSSGGGKKPKKRHGVVGFVENLGSDIKDATVGTVAGSVQVAKDLPEMFDYATFREDKKPKTVKSIEGSYKETYGPLAHGDVNTFVHNLYDHPLGPILDALTVATAGTAGATKVGLLKEAARGHEIASPAVRAGQEGKVLTRPIAGTELSRRAKIAYQKALDQIDRDLPHFGASARYARLLDRAPRQVALRLRNSAELREYNKATKNLTNEEFAALHLIGRGLHPQDYLAYLKTQDRVEPAMLKVLENRKVNELVENPSERLVAAMESAPKLTRLMESLKAEHSLGDDTMAARVTQHMDTVSEALGRPVRRVVGERFYVPDRLPGNRHANLNVQRMGGGKGVPQRPQSFKQNKGVLLRTGQLALHPDLLGPEFLNTVKYGLFDDIHDALMDSAVRSTVQPHKDWVAIRRPIRSKTGNVRPERIHPIKQNTARTKDVLGQLDETPEPTSFYVERGRMSEAQEMHGEYLWVPKRLADDLAGEFTRSDSTIRNFIQKPFQVWRALVLGFRVGFLVNNVVGNHLLYAINAAGYEGLRSYLNAVKRVKGESAVRSLIKMDGVPEALRQRFMDDFFPEQSQGGTFGRTQTEGLMQGRRARKAKRLGTGIAPATQAVAETTVRRALVESAIRRSPEFAKVYREMPKQTREFEAAAKKLLEGEGGGEFQARISQQVDDALGNYLHMSKGGQAIREILPFYSWYRAILRITFHLAVDNPIRANILSKISRLGVETTEDELRDLFGGVLPEWAKGLLPLGGDRVASTGGLNPFSTVDQLAQGTGGLLYGKPGATGKAFSEIGPNPFLLAAIENLSGKNLFTGRDLEDGRGLGQVAADIGVQLPQTQLIQAARGHGRESKTYGKQSAQEALLQYLGFPVKHVR